MKNTQNILATVALYACAVGSPLYAVVLNNTSVSEIEAQAQAFADSAAEFGPTAIATAPSQNAVEIIHGKVFVAYYTADNNLAIARRPLSGGTWQKIVFPNKMTDPDSHRAPCIAVSSSDNRMHIMWGHHGGALNYIVSKAAESARVPDDQFNATLFEPNRNSLTKNGPIISGVTYPSMVDDAAGNFMVFWRRGGSGNGETFAANYQGDGSWTAARRIVGSGGGTYQGSDGSSSSDRNAYFNDYTYRNGVLHASWTWRETAGTDPAGNPTNHDLMYAYSSDNGVTWYNRKNTLLTLPITISSPDIKFQTWDYNRGSMNQCGQASDGVGNTHVLMLAKDGTGARKYYHFWKSVTGAFFNQIDLNWATNGTERPKIYADPRAGQTALYAITTAGNTLRLYGSEKGPNNWANWRLLYTSTDSYMAANGHISSDGSKLAVLAQRKNATTATASRLDLITFDVSP